MGEHIVNHEQRMEEIRQRAATRDKFESDARAKQQAELEGMSIADRLLRKFNLKSYPYITKDEGGEFKFDVRMITSIEREAVMGLLNPSMEGTAFEKAMDELQAKAAELCLDKGVRELIIQGKFTDGFHIELVKFSMQRSMAAANQMGSFRE